MPVAIVTARAVELYLGLGLGFAIWFAAKGSGRLDPVAKNGSAGFRLLLLPGATILWPFLLVRILRGGEAPPIEHNAHRDRARGLEP